MLYFFFKIDFFIIHRNKKKYILKLNIFKTFHKLNKSYNSDRVKKEEIEKGII